MTVRWYRPIWKVQGQSLKRNQKKSIGTKGPNKNGKNIDIKRH